MSTINDSGLRSNRNPILREFRLDQADPVTRGPALYWAKKLTAEESPSDLWTAGATVSEQVFAARVLYRYAAVFSS